MQQKLTGLEFQIKKHQMLQYWKNYNGFFIFLFCMEQW